MNLPELVYSSVLTGADRVLPLIALGESKFARGVRGMHESVGRLEEWSRAGRDPKRPLVWFHAPSVGEGLQARAVMEALRALHPDVQLAYTFFSPSAESFAAGSPADVHAFLPLDRMRNARRLLDALQPSALIFTKTEVWPNYAREAARRGVPTALLSATLPSSSSRLMAPARALLAPVHSRLTMVAAISSADARRFERLHVAPERTRVMGDARFDQVARRASKLDRAVPHLALLGEKKPLTIVAGSTWPADEDRLLPAVAALLDQPGPARLIVAPHEPTAAHLGGLEARLSKLGLSHSRLTGIEAGAGGGVPPVVLIDRMGILGDLYALADIAYVGGGFGSAGLHSVLEPAAFGAPILFGPRYGNSREAGELIAVGGARAVGDSQTLRQQLEEWAETSESREAAGSAALDYVEAGLGAAEKGAHLVLEVLENAPSRSSGSA